MEPAPEGGGNADLVVIEAPALARPQWSPPRKAGGTASSPGSPTPARTSRNGARLGRREERWSSAVHAGLIRHALEHWDEPGQGAYKGLAALNADPRSNRWRVDGSGVVGDIADDQALLEWAAGVRDALLTWDAT